MLFSTSSLDIRLIIFNLILGIPGSFQPCSKHFEPYSGLFEPCSGYSRHFATFLMQNRLQDSMISSPRPRDRARNDWCVPINPGAFWSRKPESFRAGILEQEAGEPQRERRRLPVLVTKSALQPSVANCHAAALGLTPRQLKFSG